MPYQPNHLCFKMSPILRSERVRYHFCWHCVCLSVLCMFVCTVLSSSSSGEWLINFPLSKTNVLCSHSEVALTLC